MIIKTFDIGWDSNFGIRQFQHEVLEVALKNLSLSDKKAVVINSLWYTTEYHKEVLAYLHANQVDYIILVAMIDFAIPSAEWFKEIPAKVIEVGYYNGPEEIDFFALFLDRYFFSPSTIDLCRIDRIDCPFMCLNRKPHEHRTRLYNQLQQLNLHTRGIVSLGSDRGVAVQTADLIIENNSMAPNSGAEQYGISNDIVTLGDMSNWSRIFLDVVTETVYNINQHYFVSEKIYKPILGMRPFLVYADDGAEKWLGKHGFVNYLDDFSDISDLDLRQQENLVPFLEILCNQPRRYWQKN